MIFLKLTPRLFSLCEITSYFCYFRILTLPPENVHHMRIGTPCQQTSLTGEYPNIMTTFAPPRHSNDYGTSDRNS